MELKVPSGKDKLRALSAQIEEYMEEFPLLAVVIADSSKAASDQDSEFYDPTLEKGLTKKIIEYELKDNNSSTLNIFFDKNSLDLAGWKTIDSYSNEVNFLIKNIKTNILIKNEIFKIPHQENL